MRVEQSTPLRVRVWDLPTRLFHWLLVGGVALALYTGYAAPEWWLQVHLWAGYGIVALLCFRFVWAFFGSEFSRLDSFGPSPSSVADHLRGVLLLSPRTHIGHNPAGALMILGLTALLTALVVTGLLEEGGEEKLGPLAGVTPYAVGNAAKSIHSGLVVVLLVMIAAHVLGVIAESFIERQNLVTAMITGWKRVPADVEYPSAMRHPRWGAALASWTAIVFLAGGALAALSRLPPLGIPTMPPNALYARECGACHWAYHPSLLPAASWRAVIDTLEDHFGEDASLSVEETKEIDRFLQTYSAEAWDTEAANRFRLVAPDEPRRISGTAYWRQKHADVPPALFARKAVGGKGNCQACHGDAESGRFDDTRIDIPRE
jgi:cytochrome b